MRNFKTHPSPLSAANVTRGVVPKPDGLVASFWSYRDSNEIIKCNPTRALSRGMVPAVLKANPGLQAQDIRFIFRLSLWEVIVTLGVAKSRQIASQFMP